MTDIWKKALAEWGMRSWEEVLTPEERMGGPSIWGSSRWAAFKKCPFYYFARYIRHIEPREKSEALEVGGLYHEVRARYNTAAKEGKSSEESIQAGYDLLNRTEKIVPAYSSLVRRLFKGWLVHSGPGTVNDSRRDIGGIEVLVEYLEGPFPYSTRLDLWTYIQNGEAVKITEIKTASQRSGQLIASYRMDSQFLGQMYLWKRVLEPQGYPPLKEYMIDLAVKTDPAQYCQETAPIDFALLSNWEYEMTQHWRELQRYERSARPWPRRRSYHSCHWCELFNFCASNGRNMHGLRIKKDKP